MTRRASRRRDSFSASMKRKKSDLPDFFRVMPSVVTELRPAFTAPMYGILCEGTDRDEVILSARGKMPCIPNLPSRSSAAPAGANLVALVCDDRVIRMDETGGKR